MSATAQIRGVLGMIVRTDRQREDFHWAALFPFKPNQRNDR